MAAVLHDVQLPDQLSGLSTLIEERPESFASGSNDIKLAALAATKFIFDLAIKSESRSLPYISQLLSSINPAQAPKTRSQTRANGKRKRTPTPPLPASPAIRPTPLDSLFVDGMDEDQVWAQLELRTKNVCEVLEEALEGTGEGYESEDEDEDDRKRRKVVDGGDDMDEDDAGDEDFEFGEDEEASDDAESEDEDDVEDDEQEEDEELGEGVEGLRDPDGDDEDDLDLDRVGPRRRSGRRKGKGHPELDDGFFDLASFNAEVEEAETRNVSKGSLGKGSDDEESDEEAEDVDLFAAVDDPEEEDDLGSGGAEPFYKDFFDPPPKPKPAAKSQKKAHVNVPKVAGKVRFHEEVRVKKIKSNGKGLPVSMLRGAPGDDDEEETDDDEYGEQMSFDDDEAVGFGGMDSEESDEDSSLGALDEVDGEDGRETIDRLKDDLFAEEEEPDADLTTHEKRMADLQEQIAALESENVAKKDWTLLGEATARARPHNSLLEEDLDFERVMKAVPVVTEEVIHSLEERIKTRIMAANFDDVVRQRPLDDKPFLPSRFFELQDKKSTQSLAQIYEDEYTTTQTGGVAGEDRDGKLKKEHEEIEKQWDSICAKLDALCNVHFTPKQPKATISTVSNVAAATLESALPTAKSATTMLAPEEVFAANPNDLRARSELTPTEKRALHNKQKKAKRKARDKLDKSVDKFARSNRIGSVKKQKEQALKSVVKTGKGVTVVGKKRSEIVGKKGRPSKE
ncbi:hypothetical protein JAAARDRAFT_169865 [Jaapia argillacea MUCL 33604]|uniref:U3 small nucleolar ribonucleoprotein protein MPP10 n=1 Tax=Jaapia argillacea MUCL 33604 TaxID=933084 RepID=A0A067QJM2_9AGAM|nr:hypothetical protein JAAARDRAFT_169865 [Jaapia argillacea MUCL 33604]